EWLDGFSVCIGAEAGRLHVVPSGFAVSNPTSNDFLLNLLGAAALRVRLFSRLYARFGLLLTLPLIQRRYDYQTPAATSAQLYRMPQAAARAEIGLGWHF